MVFLPQPHLAEGAGDPLEPLLMGTHPTHESSALMTLSPHKDPASSYLMLGLGLYQVNFGGTQNSPQQVASGWVDEESANSQAHVV